MDLRRLLDEHNDFTCCCDIMDTSEVFVSFIFNVAYLKTDFISPPYYYSSSVQLPTIVKSD